MFSHRIFCGALDVQAKEINEEMKLAAVHAIAALVSDEELHADSVIPDPFDSRVTAYVAEAVANAAIKTGVAQKIVNTNEIKNRLLAITAENKVIV
jgi:malate dehydrogenase (oxaloacetate-decarboxylating)